MNTPELSQLRLIAAAFWAALAFPSFACAQTAVYRETFGTTKRDTYNALGWSFYHNIPQEIARNGGAATAATAVSEGVHYTPPANPLTNAPASAATNIGQAQASRSATHGLAFFNATGGTHYFGFTEEYDGSGGALTTGNLHSISFLNQSTSPTWELRVAIRVGGSWFVSEAQRGFYSAGTIATEAALLTFSNLSNITWTALKFSTAAGSRELSLGAPGQMPEGDITAFGFFGTGGTTPVRLDDFTVYTGIPEPSTYARPQRESFSARVVSRGSGGTFQWLSPCEIPFGYPLIDRL